MLIYPVLQSLTPATSSKKLLKIIYLLFKSGVDPTVEDVNGKTPQELAVVSRFTAGAALLGKTKNQCCTPWKL